MRHVGQAQESHQARSHFYGPMVQPIVAILILMGYRCTTALSSKPRNDNSDQVVGDSLSQHPFSCFSRAAHVCVAAPDGGGALLHTAPRRQSVSGAQTAPQPEHAESRAKQG